MSYNTTSPVTPATIESRATVNRLMDRMMALTGRDLAATAVTAGLSKPALESWRRPFTATHRNPSLAQLTALFEANGFRLLLAIEPVTDSADVAPVPFATATLRCGGKNKRGPVETLWLDESLAGSLYPAALAREVVVRWNAAIPAAVPDVTGSAGD